MAAKFKKWMKCCLRYIMCLNLGGFTTNIYETETYSQKRNFPWLHGIPLEQTSL
jgi:hypothetical protein